MTGPEGRGPAALSESDREVLRRRAEHLAKTSRGLRDETEGFPALVLALGPERYAAELAHVFEVLPPRPVTPVPGVPDFVRGVVAFRGGIAPVYDLAALIAGRPDEIAPAGALVVLGRDRVEFAVLVDRVEPPVIVSPAGLKDSVSRPGDPGRAYIKGYLESGIVVLNLAALLSDESLMVNQDAAPGPQGGLS